MRILYPPLARCAIGSWTNERDLIDDDSEFYYITRLDSDDLYHKSVAAEIKSQNPHVRTLLYQSGFVYDMVGERIAPYIHSRPPFYTDIFSRQEVKNKTMPHRKGGHAANIGKVRVLSPHKFVVICHDKGNSSSTFSSLSKRARRRGSYQDCINHLPTTLHDFGLSRVIGLPIMSQSARTKSNSKLAVYMANDLFYNRNIFSGLIKQISFKQRKGKSYKLFNPHFPIVSQTSSPKFRTSSSGSKSIKLRSNPQFVSKPLKNRGGNNKSKIKYNPIYQTPQQIKKNK